MLENLPSELDRGPLDPVRIFEALQHLTVTMPETVEATAEDLAPALAAA